MNLKLTLFTIFIFSSITSYAQVKPHIKMDSTAQKTTIQPSSGELQAYKLLYETAQKSYENQKETEHWFISIVILFIIFILGSQIYFNFRFNQQTINKIRSEFDNKLSNVNSEQLQKFSEQRSAITDNLLKLFKDANQIAYKAVDKLNQDLSHRLEEMDERNNEKFTNIQTDHQSSVLDTKLRLKRTSGHIYLTTKDYLFALLDYMDAAYLEINSKLDPVDSIFGILRCLGGLRELRIENKVKLVELIEKAKSIEKFNVDETNKKMISLVEEKIKELLIWTVDEDGVFRDENGSPIDMERYKDY
ncbi:MAG TPA: hypothetical protein VHD33_01805 [Legionellaceae bacterium]|nr:hypothetical protein [Legionellaceae bacterium]